VTRKVTQLSSHISDLHPEYIMNFQNSKTNKKENNLCLPPKMGKRFESLLHKENIWNWT
jgi:hypothetical protein